MNASRSETSNKTRPPKRIDAKFREASKSQRNLNEIPRYDAASLRLMRRGEIGETALPSGWCLIMLFCIANAFERAAVHLLIQL